MIFSTNIQKAKKGFHSNIEFQAIFRRHRRVLRKWLNTNYDYTLVDCPPSIAIQVKVLLNVADAFIIPSIPDNLSVRGCHYLIDRIRRTGMKTKAMGILWSLYRKADKIHCQIIEDAGQEKVIIQNYRNHLRQLSPIPLQSLERFKNGRIFLHLQQNTLRQVRVCLEVCAMK